MTTDIQIEKVLRGVSRFGGVYLYNELDNIPRLNDQAIIINYVTEDEAEEGKIGHFVALDNRHNMKKGDGVLHMYYFDPYGIETPDEARDILGLPNTHNVKRLIERSNTPWSANSHDFQAWMKGDDLCGVYSSEYVTNPNFKTNPLFRDETGSRVNIDKKLIKIYGRLDFVNHPKITFTSPQINRIRTRLKEI